MHDRIVEFPNRYRFEPVEGALDIFDLLPTPGDVKQEGTPLNKATLLTDQTAALFGLGPDATVNDAFRNLIVKREMVEFLTSGSFTVPNNAIGNLFRVTCCGGGGGGGGGAGFFGQYNKPAPGGGGGGGYIIQKIVVLIPGSSIPIVIGAGGLGGATGGQNEGSIGGTGGTGGTTIFHSNPAVSAAGGTGGTGGSILTGSRYVGGNGGNGGSGGGGGYSWSPENHSYGGTGTGGGNGGNGGNNGNTAQNYSAPQNGADSYLGTDHVGIGAKVRFLGLNTDSYASDRKTGGGGGGGYGCRGGAPGMYNHSTYGQIASSGGGGGGFYTKWSPLSFADAAFDLPDRGAGGFGGLFGDSQWGVGNNGASGVCRVEWFSLGGFKVA